jgi:hypothetical protein
VASDADENVERGSHRPFVSLNVAVCEKKRQTGEQSHAKHPTHEIPAAVFNVLHTLRSTSTTLAAVFVVVRRGGGWQRAERWEVTPKRETVARVERGLFVGAAAQQRVDGVEGNDRDSRSCIIKSATEKEWNPHAYHALHQVVTLRLLAWPPSDSAECKRVNVE